MYCCCGICCLSEDNNYVYVSWILLNTHCVFLLYCSCKTTNVPLSFGHRQKNVFFLPLLHVFCVESCNVIYMWLTVVLPLSVPHIAFALPDNSVITFTSWQVERPNCECHDFYCVNNLHLLFFTEHTGIQTLLQDTMLHQCLWFGESHPIISAEFASCHMWCSTASLQIMIFFIHFFLNMEICKAFPFALRRRNKTTETATCDYWSSLWIRPFSFSNRRHEEGQYCIEFNSDPKSEGLYFTSEHVMTPCSFILWKPYL